MLNWQGFQPASPETCYYTVFQAISVSWSSDIYEWLFPLILAQCGLEQVVVFGGFM